MFLILMYAMGLFYYIPLIRYVVIIRHHKTAKTHQNHIKKTLAALIRCKKCLLVLAPGLA
ncbi:MAG: hypothetical protein CL679_07720 [Bermanella sp.]|nr:hypothetical protein [Bermanella sp.]